MAAIFLVALFLAFGLRTCTSSLYDAHKLSIRLTTFRNSFDRRLAASANDPSPETAYCSSGVQFSAALANNDILKMVLVSDITLRDDDWTNWTLPLIITRNITVTGVNENQDEWIVLDAAYVKNKIRLSSGVYLTFTLIVLNHWREDPHFMAPGMDLIVAGPEPDATNGLTYPAVVLYDLAYVQRTCAPVWEQTRVAGSVVRPPGFAGNQSTILNISQPACENKQQQNSVSNATLHPLKRCWPLVGIREELLTRAFELDSTKSRQIGAGYLGLIYHSIYICETVMADDCVSKYTSIGCFWRMFPRNISSNGTATARNDSNRASPPPPQQATSGPRKSSRPLAYVLGGTLGGAFLVCLIVMGTFAVVKAARHRNQGMGTATPRSWRYTLRCHPQIMPPTLGDASVDTKSQSSKHALSPSSEHGQQLSSELLVSTFDNIADLALPPVTPLTPMHPNINLELKMHMGEVKLSGVTLGKGAFGRVVKGMYGGVPVAVKIIDHGLLPQPSQVKLASSGISAFSILTTFSKRSSPLSLMRGDAGKKRRPAAGASEAPMPALEVTLAPATSTVLELSETTSKDCGEDNQRMTGKNVDSHNGDAGPAPVHEPAGARTVAAGMNVDNHDYQKAIDGHNGAASVDNGSLPAIKSSATIHEGSQVISGTKPGVSTTGDGASGLSVLLAGSYTNTETVHQIQHENQEARAAGMLLTGDGICKFAEGTKGYNEEANHPNSWEPTLRQEVEVLARCQHRNVIRLLAACLTPPRFCLVMELMDTSLDRFIYGNGDAAQACIPLNTVLHIATQIALGLAYLHPTIVHRDLKPANVLISQTASCQPVVKLADFGLSRLRSTVLVTRNPEVGTAPYVAPEVFDASNFIITDRVDIYAFGIMLWEMLAGQRPWAGQNMVVIALSVAFHRLRPPLKVLSKERCPPKLRALIQSCWDSDPRRRPAAAEVVKTLALVQQALYMTINVSA